MSFSRSLCSRKTFETRNILPHSSCKLGDMITRSQEQDGKLINHLEIVPVRPGSVRNKLDVGYICMALR